jgi:hypothetical protein
MSTSKALGSESKVSEDFRPAAREDEILQTEQSGEVDAAQGSGRQATERMVRVATADGGVRFQQTEADSVLRQVLRLRGAEEMERSRSLELLSME